MSYIDAYHDREKDQIHIVERVNGKRITHSVQADYSFYYLDPKGNYVGMSGERLSKFSTNSSKAFYKESKLFEGRATYEADVKPIFKALEKLYKDSEIPELHTASIDIEVDFCKERGFAPPHDPHQRITAITVNLDWQEKLVTLCLAPKTLSQEEAQAICDKFPDCFVCETEEQMLEIFYDLIEDVDILYTWNGEGFDIPYIVNRTTRIMGKELTRKLCLWNQFPKKREFERYGKKQETYDIIGRVHLDYLQLYRKYTYHELHSYRLDAVGEYELNETKVQYEGTLDHLYNHDFEKFIAYNRQDTLLLTKLENKLKFIMLTNTLAHESCVLLPTTMGAVALTDQSIVLESHSRGVICPSRKHGQNDEDGIPGGYVADPKQGLTNLIGSVDINSLYPSAIRALNMSPETLVAQVLPTKTKAMIESKKDRGETFADAWNNVFSSLEYDEIMERTDAKLDVYVEASKTIEKLRAADIYEWIFSEGSNLCISANGTVFKTDQEGIIPGLLTKWYAQRKEMQANLKAVKKQITETTDEDKLKELYKLEAFWDQRQLAKKIQLNSLYGAVSNVASRFADQRIGQSTTLTGRTITKHMNAKANEILIGKYDHQGECIVYSDTDSSYFTVSPVLDALKEQGVEIDKDNFVDLSDNIADQINDSFPEFVLKSFNIQEEKGRLIRCGREICAVSGLFVKKKRYAVLYYDKEGKREDKDGKPGALKIMGMDTQRADTPKSIQDFLKEILTQVLSGKNEVEVVDFIRNFKEVMRDLPSWEKGTPKRVNNLSMYRNKVKNSSKVTVPGHVRASLNWNSLREMNGDMYSMEISDGQKVIVCKMKNNPMNMTSVAYPIDEFNLPDWFKTLPFDDETMIQKLIDQKLDNIIGILNWNIEISKVSNVFSSLFKLEE